MFKNTNVWLIALLVVAAVVIGLGVTALLAWILSAVFNAIADGAGWGFRLNFWLSFGILIIFGWFCRVIRVSR